jgi:hypothetical protein
VEEKKERWHSRKMSSEKRRDSMRLWQKIHGMGSIEEVEEEEEDEEEWMLGATRQLQCRLSSSKAETTIQRSLMNFGRDRLKHPSWEDAVRRLWRSQEPHTKPTDWHIASSSGELESDRPLSVETRRINFGAAVLKPATEHFMIRSGEGARDADAPCHLLRTW